jgi:hypothetical protein
MGAASAHKTTAVRSNRNRSGRRIENRWDVLGVVDTGADPDYVRAAASRDRLELANEAARYTTSMRRPVAGGCMTQYTRPIDSFTPQDDAMSGVPLLWKRAKESAQNISEAKLHCTLGLPALEQGLGWLHGWSALTSMK